MKKKKGRGDRVGDGWLKCKHTCRDEVGSKSRGVGTGLTAAVRTSYRFMYGRSETTSSPKHSTSNTQSKSVTKMATSPAFQFSSWRGTESKYLCKQQLLVRRE